MEQRILGIDIGGTRIKWCLTDGKAHILERQTFATNDALDGLAAWRNQILDLIKAKASEAKGASFSCGISAPGLVDDQNQKVLFMPERLKGIENFHWTEACGLPVVVLNDGHAATLAEYETTYKPLGVRHFLMLTLGTGVGGGLIINGTLYQGHLQRAGHMGHMTLDIHGARTMTNMPGSLEHAMGNFSVSERTNGSYATTRELVQAYKNGDATATKYWLASIDRLAVALAGLTNMVAPQVISLGGGIAEGAQDALLEPLSAAMHRYEWRPGGHKIELKKATLGTYAGAMGAAMFANLKRTT